MAESDKCPFCGERMCVMKEDDVWYLECRGIPKHRFQFEGMNFCILFTDVIENALNEFKKRV